MNISILLGIASIVVVAGLIIRNREQQITSMDEAGMWCPKCGCQYRIGFTECADCNVKLSANPPAINDPTFTNLAEIGFSLDASKLALTESALMAHGIKYVVQHSSPHSNHCHVLVPSEHVTQARELVQAILDNCVG